MWGHFILSSLIFCSIGIISPGRMHLYLALLFHRDYFARLDASLSGSFVPQGLFHPAECISIWLFCSTGITLPRLNASLSGSFVPQGLLYPGWMHLYRALLCRRDYFGRPDASHHWKAIAKNISARPFRRIQVCWCRAEAVTIDKFPQTDEVLDMFPQTDEVKKRAVQSSQRMWRRLFFCPNWNIMPAWRLPICISHR